MLICPRFVSVSLSGPPQSIDQPTFTISSLAQCLWGGRIQVHLYDHHIACPFQNVSSVVKKIGDVTTSNCDMQIMVLILFENTLYVFLLALLVLYCSRRPGWGCIRARWSWLNFILSPIWVAWLKLCCLVSVFIWCLAHRYFRCVIPDTKLY